MAHIKFVPSADASVVSAQSRAVLDAILNSAGLPSCVITSTVRSPAKQARAMFVNIEATSVQTQFNLYGQAGKKVIQEYERLKPLGHNQATILSAMEAVIIAQGPDKVSRHCGDPSEINVIDIAPSSIADRAVFLQALKAALAAGTISKFLSPANGDPAFHIEIKQKSSRKRANQKATPAPPRRSR